MASLAKCVCILGAIFVVAFAAYVFTDLPTDIDDHMKVAQWLAVKRTVKLMAGLGELVGIGSHTNMTRTLNGWLLRTSVNHNVKVTDSTFAGVTVRMYRPVNTERNLLPAVVYIPGGGWTYNNIELYNGLASHMAAEAGVAVVSLEYRSSPENVFPVAFEDCLSAVVHFMRNARTYDVDEKRIAVAGDDSGGNLAAAIANRLSFEANFLQLKFHAVFYPLLQAFDFNLPSYRTRARSYSSTTAGIVADWLSYFQGNHDDLRQFLVNNHTDVLMKISEYAENVNVSRLPSEYRSRADEPLTNPGNSSLVQRFEPTLLNPYYCPLMAVEFATLPAAYILTTEHDPARDDGLLYVARLREAGVEVVHKHYRRAGRGFLQTVGAFWEKPLAREAIDDFVKFIRANI